MIGELTSSGHVNEAAPHSDSDTTVALANNDCYEVVTSWVNPRLARTYKHMYNTVYVLRIVLSLRK